MAMSSDVGDFGDRRASRPPALYGHPIPPKVTQESGEGRAHFFIFQCASFHGSLQREGISDTYHLFAYHQRKLPRFFAPLSLPTGSSAKSCSRKQSTSPA